MQGLLILFPVFGGEKAAAKIRTVKGLRVEIFSCCARKNTTRPLTVRIVQTLEYAILKTGGRLKNSQNSAIIKRIRDAFVFAFMLF